MVKRSREGFEDGWEEETVERAKGAGGRGERWGWGAGEAVDQSLN